MKFVFWDQFFSDFVVLDRGLIRNRFLWEAKGPRPSSNLLEMNVWRHGVNKWIKEKETLKRKGRKKKVDFFSFWGEGRGNDVFMECSWAYLTESVSNINSYFCLERVIFLCRRPTFLLSLTEIRFSIKIHISIELHEMDSVSLISQQFSLIL